MRTVLALTALALLTLPAGTTEETHPGYRWQELGDGIYLHSRSEPLAAPVDGNSVVIVNDTDVFVVDTHIDPAAARAVIGKIRDTTDLPVTLVVNTHWHDDHVNGNHAYREAFTDARFVAHRSTVERLREDWEKFAQERMATFDSVRQYDLDEVAASVEAEDPDRATGIRLLKGYRDALEPELQSMSFVYPEPLDEETAVFERGERTIEVRWAGRGNTDGDLVVWLPRERVLITGDVVVRPVPFAFSSPMTDWVETLRSLPADRAATIVPGHGPALSDASYVHQLIALLESTLSGVREARAAGVSFEELAEAVDLSAHREAFIGGNPAADYAWRSYYLVPGLQSAWTALGYPVPES